MSLVKIRYRGTARWGRSPKRYAPNRHIPGSSDTPIMGAVAQVRANIGSRLAEHSFSRGHLWLLALLAVGIGLLATAPSSTSAGGTTGAYLLSAQDKIRIAIFEWRPSKDEFFEWKALNADYNVQPNGNVSIPLLGEVRAAGLSTSDLAQSIGTLLQDRTGVAQVPNVTIEIVSFRPIYITGQVDRPGEFAYRPNLMVMQAVALSGGLRRPPPGQRVERDVVNARSELSSLTAEYDTLLARKARLEAEAAELDRVKFPPTLTERTNDAALTVLMQRESQLFETRRSAHQSQIRTLQELRQYLEGEVVSVQQQLEAHRRQMDLVKKELDGITVLITKGLSVEPRRLGLERNLAQLEGERLRLESTMTRARQEISKTAISILEADTKREIEAAEGLSVTHVRLEEVSRRFEANKKLLQEAEALAPVLSSDIRSGARVQPSYTIIRQGAGGIATEITAAETTPVQPGDTIKVEVPVNDKPIGSPEISREEKLPSRS